jgi:cell division protein ZapA
LRKVEFKILGDTYVIETELSDDEAGEVMELVRRRVEEISNPGTAFLSKDDAVLTTLNMATEYVRLKREFATYRRKMNAYLVGLSKRIEESL